MRHARRALLLFICVATGVVVGVVGERLTGASEWFLAIPACVALIWLFVADPRQCQACEPPRRRDGGADAGSGGGHRHEP